MELTEREQEALNKVEGLKKYTVYTSELVYYSKEVWANNEMDAQLIANEAGFTNDDIYDGDNFEINGVEEES